MAGRKDTGNGACQNTPRVDELVWPIQSGGRPAGLPVQITSRGDMLRPRRTDIDIARITPE